MGSVVELRPRQKEDFTSSLGMMIFLASWAMMFSALFFAYGFVRSRAVMWPPPGVPALPIALPAVNTLVLLASSFTFARGLRELKQGRRRAFPVWVVATFVLGAVFLGLQLHVWRAVAASGLTLNSSMYGSVFYSLTTFHALHVGVGLLLLLWVFARSLFGSYSEHNYINIRLITMFWHFVDVVWILMFVSIYLL
jgi:cytochrome c oxidase subunit 3